jgi:molecular chaperone DnaJ
LAKRDYYDLLGVPKTADAAALKAAFRKRAMEVHPDRNPGDQEAERRFKELNEAFQILSDPQKRAAYDRFGHQAFEQGGMGPGGFGPEFSASMSTIFEDIFGDVFGAGSGRRPGQRGGGRGADIRYDLELSLEEAFSGKKAEIRVPNTLSCEVCSGSGAKPGTKPKPCQTCGGAGRVRASQGFFMIERTCPACQGRGQTIEDPCRNCTGSGRVTRERKLSIDVPPGVEEGTRIRLAGEGEGGLRGSPAGDLYLFISVRPHGFFSRDGADLFCRVPVSMVAAALGTEISVPTLGGGTVDVPIPEGTQSGRQFRIRGRGMPVLRSRNAGDLYVQAIVETPQNLTSRQRELLEAFQSASSTQTHPESEGFFAKVKEFFTGSPD